MTIRQVDYIEIEPALDAKYKIATSLDMVPGIF